MVIVIVLFAPEKIVSVVNESNWEAYGTFLNLSLKWETSHVDT